MKKEKDYLIKLKKIFEKTISIIEKYHPDEIAIEAPFLGKNAQSMLKLGRAQGVAISAGLSREIPVSEYMPKKVKLALTGSGNSSKYQVLGMVKNILNLKEIKLGYDSSDAMAVAICHHMNRGKKKNNKEYSNWGAFIENNKNRVS